MPQSRVLVVEDDPDLKEALQLWFDKRDCDVTFASNGEEGLMVLRSGEPIDLVLTDFMMPQLNGMELLRLVKSNVNMFTTKIVVMSSNTNPEFRKRAAELGAIQYISKVDTARDIVDKVVKILGGPASVAAPAPAEPLPETTLPAGEIRIMTENLMNLLRVIHLVEGVPPAAKTAVEAANKLATRIHESVVKAGSHRTELAPGASQNNRPHATSVVG